MLTIKLNVMGVGRKATTLGLVINKHLEAAFQSAQVSAYQHSDT